MMKLWLGSSLALLLVACGAQNAPTTASSRYDFGNIRWASEAKVEMKAHTSVPNEYLVDIQDTFVKWNAQLDKPLLYPRQNQTIERTYRPFSNQDGVNGIYFVCENWSYGREGHEHETQAITQINLSDGQIVEADILVNCQDFQYSHKVDVNKVHLESLILHESGHVIGLPHDTQNPSAIMYVRLALGVERLKFTKSDFAGLRQADYPLAANIVADGLALVMEPEKSTVSKSVQIQFSSEVNGCEGHLGHE